MGRTPLSGGTAFRFLPSEVADMEKALDASSGATPARSIVESLAEKFTNSSERTGQRPVQWKQVWNWFQNRRHAQKAKIDKLKAVGSGGETPPAAKVVTVAGPSTAKKPNNVPMDFEAKSARDGAWYDVSAFINKRTAESGEAEVRVRFAGFGSEEDEWVNIATAVRQRSLPCETTECVAVLPGDLILCFQEGSEQALYFDADILDVQRRRHDVRGCRCRFWVRYRHDQTEEVVPLRKVCRRPETEQRLQQAREAGAPSNKLSNKDISIEIATRTLNGTPHTSAAPQIPPATPATAVTPAQPSAAFTPTSLPGTSSNLYTPVPPGTTPPGLNSLQPIPMQSIATPDSMSSIHQQAGHPQGAPAHPVSTFQGNTPVQAISFSEGSTPSTSIAATLPLSTSTPAQQQSLPSIENSLAHQLSISAPAQQQATPGTGVAIPIVEQHAIASTGVAGTGNLTQPMEIVSNVSSTPAAHQTGPPSAAQVSCSVEIRVPTASNAPSEEEKSLASKDSSTVPVDEPIV